MKPSAMVEGLIAENPFRVTSSSYDYDGKREEAGREIGRFGGSSTKSGIPVVDKHIDVSEEEGWIIIPCKELPDSGSEEPDMLLFSSLDRPFVFPGEQVHILACLSTYKQDIEIITPFNVAEVMNKNCIGQDTKQQNDEIQQGSTHVPEVELNSNGQNVDQNANDLSEGKNSPMNNFDGASLLRTEEYRRTEVFKRFRDSVFFARMAEADEPLWSKRKIQETFPLPVRTIGRMFIADDVESCKDANKKPPQSLESVDRASLDASTSSGVASSGFKCSLLANGDIVVVLQVSIGVNVLKDPVLEILQFEKYQERTLTSGSVESVVHPNQEDPCRDLLKWLLPVEKSKPSQPRSLSPPQWGPSSSIRSSDTNPNLLNLSGSQKRFLGHVKSHSMSSIPPSRVTPSVPTSSPRSKSDLEDWDRFSFKSEKGGAEGLLSFRGVPLVPERFSVRCGLEGLYVPGRRWRRTVEVIQPIKIHSFVAHCNTEDLLCVQIKNVSPAHAQDLVIYLDAITVVCEEVSKGGPASYLPITCIEAGHDHVLPDLPLRKGEEHSFVLKPETSPWRGSGGHERSSRPSRLPASRVRGRSNAHHSAASPADKYAILVSCRCNYTESSLFFKQPTSWQPHIPRDISVSVASQMPRKTLGSDDRVPRLPVQVLTLQASNLTSRDLTLTVSLDSSTVLPTDPFGASSESTRWVSGDSGSRLGSSNEQKAAISDVPPRSDLGCTHLWLQSRVPLGCVPSRSTSTINLEMLPLIDGIITLDSLRIHVEKGLTYVTEQPLKIHATSSLSTKII